MNGEFIKTQDEETAEKLRKYFNELPKQGNFYVFINDSTVANFENNNKVIYSNKLYF